MKKLLLIFTLGFAPATLLAQKQVVFKPVYLPKTTYTDIRDMRMVMTMTQDSVGVGGIAINMSMSSSNVIATGSAVKNGMLPVVIDSHTLSRKATMNGQDMPVGTLPNTDVKAYGRFDGASLRIDSIAGQHLPDSMLTAITKQLLALQNTIKFPAKPLKVGNAFVQDTPFSIPMMQMGNNGKVTVTMTYKLLSTANDTAVFDLVENMRITLDQTTSGQKIKMQMTGTGSGTVSYNISKQYVATMVNTLTINFEMNGNGASMKGQSTMITNDRVALSAN